MPQQYWTCLIEKREREWRPGGSIFIYFNFLIGMHVWINLAAHLYFCLFWHSLRCVLWQPRSETTGSTFTPTAVKQHCFGSFFSLVFIVKHLQIDWMLSVFLKVSFDYYNKCHTPMLFLHIVYLPVLSLFHFQYPILSYTVIRPVSQLTCLCLWATSMCRFNNSKCLFRVRDKVM